ncbi:MAG: hypothetical protein D3916_08655 [Candidatus Electrothrix sp. MAN1_4]|nr:hypothetical protein [Candidatus Electrothrix sp. MAN1_4]
MLQVKFTVEETQAQFLSNFKAYGFNSYVLRGGCYQKLVDATDETITFTLKECVIDFDFFEIWE